MMKSKIKKVIRVLVGVIGYFIIAASIGDMDITNTMTSVHFAYIGIGLILFFGSIVVDKVKIIKE